MANEQKIDEIIDPKAFAQLDKLLSQLGIARSEFVGFAKDINEANKAIAKGQSFKDFEANSNKATIAMEKMNQQRIKTQLLEQKLADARAKAAADFEAKVQKEIQAMERKAAQTEKTSAKERLAQIKLDQDTKKAFDNYEKGLQKKQAADKKHADQIAKNSRAYTILSNELERQRSAAQDLAVIYGETSPQFLEAAKGVIELDTRLKAIDKTLGKSQRFVGEYERAYNGFGNAVNQLTRELPSLAVNAQTFFLAISNNLPALFDAIQTANRLQKEAKEAALADAEAKGQAAKATELAAGATEEAASAAGDFAKEQALAAAEALKTPGAFKQFIGSLFSLQTALSLGITLLTIYGAEVVSFIADLFKGSQAADAAAKRFENLNKAFDDPGLADAIKNINELTINIKLAKDGLIDKEEVLKQYNESIGKTTGEVKSLDEAERALVKNAKDYIQMTLYKAAAQLTLDEAAKAAVESAKNAADRERAINKQKNSAVIAGDKEGEAARKILLKERKRVNDEQLKDEQENIDGLSKLAADFQKKAADITSGNGWDFFPDDKNKSSKANTDAIDLLIQRAQAEADIAKRIADNQNRSLEDRLAAVKKYGEASTQIAELTAKKELSEADLSKSRVIAIKENQQNEILRINDETASSTLKINQDAEKELAKLLKDGLAAFTEAEQKKIEAMRVTAEQQQQLLSEYADSALLGLAEQYSKGIINEKQYAQAKLDVQRQYVLDSINEEIKGVEAIIAAKKKGGLDTAADEKALAELRKKLSKETTDQQIQDLEELAKKEQELYDKKKELSSAVADLGISIVNGVFENQKNKIQEQIDLDERRKQIDIENVNNSVASEEDKANRIAIIEARAAAQKQQLEQQQREIDQRKARFEKAMSISRIIANTAVGVTAALTSIPPNVPLSIVIGAIGLAQVAKVIADPIPKYQSGTEYSKEGFALTDEAGPEGYIFPDGRALIGSDKPNYKYLPKGTKVIPHHQLISMDAKDQLQQSSSTYSMDFKPLIRVTEQGHEKIVKALRSKKGGNSGPSKTGWYNTQYGMYKMSNYYRRNL